MSYRQSPAFLAASYFAARQNAETSAKAKRATLDNVGRNPLALRQRVFATVEAT